MVKISIGKSVNVTLGNKNKKDPAPKEPVQRRCSVCGNYTTSTSDHCPKCHSRM